MLSLAHFADLPKLLALAAHDNVAVKISDACTLSREPFPYKYKDLWDPLGRVFDAFSFDGRETLSWLGSGGLQHGSAPARRGIGTAGPVRDGSDPGIPG
jgi:hypothetical protein